MNIWERLKVTRNELDAVRGHEPLTDEMCCDLEEVLQALKQQKANSHAQGEPFTPDLELVRLAKELEHELIEQLSKRKPAH